jgi:hypothetical protein
MNMIDFKKGTITIKYKEYATVPITGQTLPSQVDKSIVLNLTGNTVSLLNNASPLPTPSDRIVIKGGEGTIAQVNLFGTPDSNGKFKALEIMKNGNYLINEANLVFYADKTAMSSSTIPPRIFLYDLRNKRPIIDYFFDNTTNITFNGNKIIHDGIKEDVSGSTSTTAKYKIRLTNHIRNLVSKDSTNVSLGLAVCYNINNSSFYKAKSAPSLGTSAWDNLNYNDKNGYFYPVSSIMNPLGLTLYNNTMPVDNTLDSNYSRRVQLEIWYTKPN